MRPRTPRKAPKPSHPSRRRIVIGIVIALVVVLLGVSGRVLGFYVDWLWFGEVGFRSVFWTQFWWQVLVGLAAFAVFFIIVEFNVELARRLAPSYAVTATGDLLEPRSEKVRKWVGIGGLGVSLLAAVIAGWSASGQWQTFLLYVKQAPFGEKDVLFGHDIGFYVFSLPMWQALQNFVFGALVASLVLAAIMHLVMGGIDYKATPPGGAGHGAGGAGESGEQGSPFARAQRAAAPQLPQIDVKLGGRAVAHLSGILAAIFVVVGVGQLFRGWNLLYSTAGAIYGAALHGRAHPPAAHLRDAGHRAAPGGGASVEHLPPPSVVAARHRRLDPRRGRAARHRPGRVPVAHRQPEPAHQGTRVHRQQPGRHEERLPAQRHHAAAARRPRRRSHRRSSRTTSPR